MEENVRVRVSEELCPYIADYIERNSVESREIISKNIEVLKAEPSCKIKGGYRFWKFHADKILDLIMGYSIRIVPSGFLSYYGFLNRTSAVFESLYDEGSLCGAIETCQDENMINVSRFVEIYGSSADKALLEEYRDECEIFRVGVESYALNIKTNIKFVILHNEMINYAHIPKNLVLPIEDHYSAIDVTNPMALETLRFKLKKLHDDKKVLTMQGVKYFLPKAFYEQSQKAEPVKMAAKDILTPAGNKMFSFKVD